MSTYTSEPGTRLAGRYRLVDQVSSGTGWTYWKATDETLARSVTVLTFATGFPRVTETVTAARAASRLGDPRFSQVFDVEDGEELAYVVLEWVATESLLDMLAEGPLEPARAAALVVEAARAIAGGRGRDRPAVFPAANPAGPAPAPGGTFPRPPGRPRPAVAVAVFQRGHAGPDRPVRLRLSAGRVDQPVPAT